MEFLLVVPVIFFWVIVLMFSAMAIVAACRDIYSKIFARDRYYFNPDLNKLVHIKDGEQIEVLNTNPHNGM